MFSPFLPFHCSSHYHPFQSTSLSFISPVFTMSIKPSITASPSEFVILGSGVSTGIPVISCIIRPSEHGACRVCTDAHNNPKSKNRRNNVCALIRHSGTTVLIDCGKTMRDSVIHHFPALGIIDVNAIVLTHGHADAVLGLDDARDVQRRGMRNPETGLFVTNSTPVYLNKDTMEVCQRVFPYLIREENEKLFKNDIPRRVAALRWNVFSEADYLKPFYPVKGVPIQLTPIKMWHGGVYVCMGYLIRMQGDVGSGNEKVIAYLSDLHALPKESMRFLKSIPRIDLLVIDVLTSRRSGSHLSRPEAIELIRKLRPIEAVAVGMTCSIGLHDQVNEELALLEKEEGIKFRLAYDGERFPC